MTFTDTIILILLACVMALMVVSIVFMVKFFDMEDKIEYLEKQNRDQKKQIELQKSDINMLLRMKV